MSTGHPMTSVATLAHLIAPIGPIDGEARSGPAATFGRHDHGWVLRAITHEDGAVLEEYECSGCGELTFR